MRIEILAMAAMCAAALMYIGGAESAEAHDFAYFNGVIDVMSYDVTEYADFDLVRMTVQIENLQSGGSVYELVLAIDDGSVVSHVPYGDVRGRGAEVSVDDCASHGRAPHIPASGVANVTACFMANSGFGADPSSLRVDFGAHEDCGSTCSWHQPTWTPHAAFGQVVPFHKESVYCFVDHSGYCNANNIQHIDGTAAPEPELEPEPELPEPEPAILLHAIYHNQTGVLTLVFDQLVVANNPDRIHLIHDIGAFIQNGTAPDLEDAELNTADGKRQSAILSFTLSDALRLDVIQAIQTYGDLALLIDTEAVYAADGFVDITAPDSTPILVPDVFVVS